MFTCHPVGERAVKCKIITFANYYQYSSISSISGIDGCFCFYLIKARGLKNT